MSEDYKRMFEMKQDDWIEACKEIDVLKIQLAASQESEARLRKALEVYADPNNWTDEESDEVYHPGVVFSNLEKDEKGWEPAQRALKGETDAL